MADVKKHQELANELSNKLWAMANDLRGNMEAYEFKNYILGLLFYKELSDRTEKFVAKLLEEDGIEFKEAWEDEEYKEAIVDEMLIKLGYVLEPQYLFPHMLELIRQDKFSIDYFEEAINSIIASTQGQDSEADFDGLFEDMDLKSSKLGKEIKQRSKLIGKVLQTIDSIEVDLGDTDVDVLGTAYVTLIGLFAQTAGKKGGEFYTPTNMSKLVARLATVGLTKVLNVADCACGSGSLLLQVGEYVDVAKYYGQELTSSTYNLARMNMILHGIDYKNFSIINVDTLEDDTTFEDEKYFIQVANPPYSTPWSADKRLLEDDRYSPYGKLAPASRADFAFVQHMVHHMANGDSRIAVLLPHGALSRTGSEATIRKYLIKDLNVVDAIIGLPANCFQGAELPVCCWVLKKERNGNSDNVCFIDASQYFTPGRTINYITDEDIERILDAYTDRTYKEKFCYVASLKEIEENDYNLNILRYVDTFEREARVDIPLLQEKLETLIAKNKELDELIEEKRKHFVLSEGSESIPKMRIKGKETAYKKHKIRELFTKISKKNKDGSITNVITNSAREGLIPQTEYFLKDIANQDNIDGYTIIEKGDFVYNPRKSIEAPYGPFNSYTLDETGVVSPLYTCFHPQTDFDANYLLQLFKSDVWHRYVYSHGDVGARHDRVSIKDDVLQDMPLFLPDIEEQRAVSDFLNIMEQKIANEKQILETLEQIKKGYMQQMFV